MVDLTQEIQKTQEMSEEQEAQEQQVAQPEEVERYLWPVPAEQSPDELYERLLAACLEGRLERELLTVRTIEEAAVAEKMISGTKRQVLTLAHMRRLVGDVDQRFCGVTRRAYNRDDPDLIDPDRDCFETPEAFGLRLGDAAELFLPKIVKLSVKAGIVNPLEPECDEEMLRSMNLACFQGKQVPGFWWVKALRLEGAGLPKPWLLKLCDDPQEADYTMVSLQQGATLVEMAGIYQRPFAKGVLMLIPVGYAKLEYRPEIDGEHSVEAVQAARADTYVAVHRAKKQLKWQNELDARKAMSAAVMKRVQWLQEVEGLAERFMKLESNGLEAVWPGELIRLTAGLYNFRFGRMTAEYSEEGVSQLRQMVEQTEQEVTTYRRKMNTRQAVTEAATRFPVEVNDLWTAQTITCRKEIPFRSPMLIAIGMDRIWIYNERKGTELCHIDYEFDDINVCADKVLPVIRSCYKMCRNAVLRWFDEIWFKVDLG